MSARNRRAHPEALAAMRSSPCNFANTNWAVCENQDLGHATTPAQSDARFVAPACSCPSEERQVWPDHATVKPALPWRHGFIPWRSPHSRTTLRH